MSHDDNTGPDLSAPDEQAIEQERARRLDPANRAENAEVDNTGTTLPTVEAFAEMNAADGDEVDGSAGTSDPGKAFREIEVTEEEQRRIAEEREQRLDPGRRPDNAEVDNTGRRFEDGRFVD